MRSFIVRYWRDVVARLPLPMLGLAAAYGVYRFASLFVPGWVAIVQAASFELVYLGLAVVQGFDDDQRRRSRYVGLGAVFVSVVYNSLDSLFHRRPDMLVSTPLWGDVVLSVLHGAPLALVAYFVADLLLHSSAAGVSSVVENNDRTLYDNRLQSPKTVVGGRRSEYSLDRLKTILDGRDVVKRADVVAELGCSTTTASELLAQAVDAGLLRKNGVGYYVEG